MYSNYKHSDKDFILGVDVGGSHITAGLIDAASGKLIESTIERNPVANNSESEIIFEQWVNTLRSALTKISSYNLKGIGFAMPGPFNYEEGICLMQGVNKYNALYEVNISKVIREQLNLTDSLPLKFENDACCFGLGESLLAEASQFKKIIAITLGTGFGSAFIDNSQIKKTGDGIPPSGQLYNFPYQDGIAEDYISSAWLLNTYNDLSGHKAKEVLQIAERAITRQDQNAKIVFQEFGNHLGACLIPWIKSFRPECLVIGGSISKSSALFISPLEAALLKEDLHPIIKISALMERSSLSGAAYLINQDTKTIVNHKNKLWRKTSQALLPDNIITHTKKEGYDMYPFYSIGDGKIFSGYDSLAAWMSTQKSVMIDGYGGNDWKAIQSNIADCLIARNIRISWFESANFQKPVGQINEMVNPFLGEVNSVWGKRAALTLSDFFDSDAINSIQPDSGSDLSVIIGTGASFANWQALIYVDLPKNEIQYRMRAGSITNLGNDLPESSALMYKRFYFVDWVVLNKHRELIANKIAVIVDGQWKDTINWAYSSSIQAGMLKMSTDAIRARPWFEAGTWGGQWMKEHIEHINKNEINYAWSFELITPENGLILESDNNLLEISFDWLMEWQCKAVLGKDAEQFGTAFPIRFDFLDTFDGANLSIQCHPSLTYIQQHFGEEITQDETYYILDCKNSAKVYLGFQEDIDPEKFRTELESSADKSIAIDMEKYVQSFPSNMHDLFLIPNGTIHSAGKDNMVLEISATPYIFTFKMYDWVRLDLEGVPRPINIYHAFKNLNFGRKGQKVKDELISKQAILEEHDDWKIVNLPTHSDHFYAIHRIEFTGKVNLQTGDQCHVMMLVEGESVIVKTKNGKPRRFNYAETFIIPAAAGEYEIINNGKSIAKVIMAFIK